MGKILFATSEVYPLIKTGGLADVSASLTSALKQQGEDIRIILPAYRQCLAMLDKVTTVATLELAGFPLPVAILEARLANSDLPIWLVDSPQHFDRDGGPYGTVDQGDWADNAARFTLFSRAIAAIAMDEAGLSWQADILHCNDWQTGLAPALIASLAKRPAIVFTIHNLAYQGLYSQDVFNTLGLPQSLWDSEGIEFYGMMSFIKGGLMFADHITTVSPRYAEEICSDEFGYGLAGLLQHRAKQQRLTGILNGIDTAEWDPEHDKFINKNYSVNNMADKAVNKQVLQQLFALPEQHDSLVIGLISRLVEQKGIDLSVAAVASLLAAKENIQFICLGSGEADYEEELRALHKQYPDKVALHIGYDEPLSHQIEAGADVLLMPSRFEPCGLNQLYSLRYGTLPIVRNIGGLADSVVDSEGINLTHGFATGFKFDQATVTALEQTLKRALALFKQPSLWRRVMTTAMQQDYSWQKSSMEYRLLYNRLRNSR